MAKNGEDARAAAFAEGWNSACQLYSHLHSGGSLPVPPPSALRLNPDETYHAEAMLGYARFYGMNVSAQQNSGFYFGSTTFVAAGMIGDAIGNAHARNKAAAMSAAQWREHSTVRAVLTDKRILCDVRGQWLSFWHNGVVELAADLTQYSFVLRYEVGEPMMLHGPGAPWYAVAVARIVYGERGLQLAPLAPIAQAAGGAPQQQALPPGE